MGELVDGGRVEPSGKYGRNENGHLATLWRLVVDAPAAAAPRPAVASFP